MATKPEIERLGIVETKVDTLIEGVKAINTKLDTSSTTYATKQELRTFKWITVPLAVLLSAVLTALVIFYLSHGSNITDITNGANGTTTRSSGSTGTTTTTSTSTAHSDQATPDASQTSTGGVQVTLPKVP